MIVSILTNDGADTGERLLDVPRSLPSRWYKNEILGESEDIAEISQTIKYRMRIFERREHRDHGIVYVEIKA